MVLVVAAGCVAGAASGCRKGVSAIAGLARKKQATELGGGDVMSRLGAPATRAEAALEIGREKLADAVPALCGYLEDGDPDVRANCLWALGEIGDRSTIIHVKPLLTDRQTPVRLAAARALGRIPGIEAVLWLGQSVTKDGETAMRVESARALGQIKDPCAAEWLVAAVSDEQQAVATAAADGLLKIGKAAIGPMGKRMRMGRFPPQHPGLRLMVEKLAAMRDPETGEALVIGLAAGAASGDAPTVKIASDALVALGAGPVEPLAETAVRKPGGISVKRAAADIMKRVGKPYVAPVAARIMSFKTFPDQRELAIWVDVLKAIGGDDAKAAEALKTAEKQLDGQFVIAPSDTDRLTVYPAGAVADELFGPGPVSPVDFPPVPKTLPTNVELRLTLEGGLISPRRPRSIELDIFRHGGKWRQELRGTCYQMHKGIYTGRVLKSDGGDTSARLSVEVAVREDPWIVVGGFATYEVEIAYRDGAWKGTFTGEFNGRPVKGVATAEVVPWYGQPTAEPDLVSGEHPRLFFRKRDIGIMRNRARTPLGGAIVKALLARVSEARQWVDEGIGWGLLYHLLDEPEYGRQAVAVFKEEVKIAQGHAGTIHDSAHHHANLALAYDLAYNAMTAEDRKEINDVFLRRASTLGVKGLGNNCLSCNSNWSAVSFGPGGMAALSVLKEKGPYDLLPPDERGPVTKVEPLADKPATDGVPVVEPKDNELMTDWLLAAPVHVEPGKDPLASIGGMAAAKITAGTELASGGTRVKFTPIPKSALQYPDPGIPMDPHIMAMAPDATGRAFLYAILKVTAERSVKISTPYPMKPTPTFLYVNGRKFANGDCLVLSPGLYTMLVEMTGQTAAPKFLPVNGPLEHGAHLRYKWEMDRLAERQARHAGDGEYSYAEDAYKMSSHLMNRYFRHAIGDHGWKTEPEGYTSFSLYETLTLAAGYRSATGHHLAYGTGMGWALPMELMREAPGGGQGYSGGFGLPTGHLWPAMHLAPKELQPAIVWEINRRFPPERLTGLSCRALGWLLANYPFDMKPEHPEKIMPKVMADRRKGAYLFRKTWGTPDDILTTMFWRSEKPKGGTYFHPQAGGFRINGFGTAFAAEGPGSKREWQYVVDNVVAIEGNNAPGLGTVTYFSHKPDGSGVVGADMSDVYNAPTKKDPNGIGVKAERHFAVDYSGASGAPAMWVVADKVKGGGKKSWLLHNGKDAAVSVQGNTFTLTARGGATLKGTVVAPAGANVSTEMPAVDMEEINEARAAKNKGKPAKKAAPLSVGGAAVNLPAQETKHDLSAGTGVCVTGGDEFLVVMTMQKGTPPPMVQATGAGFDAVVTVRPAGATSGGVTVRIVPADAAGPRRLLVK